MDACNLFNIRNGIDFFLSFNCFSEYTIGEKELIYCYVLPIHIPRLTYFYNIKGTKFRSHLNEVACDFKICAFSYDIFLLLSEPVCGWNIGVFQGDL